MFPYVCNLEFSISQHCSFIRGSISYERLKRALQRSYSDDIILRIGFNMKEFHRIHIASARKSGPYPSDLGDSIYIKMEYIIP